MHKFTPSGLDKSLCITCKRPLKDHTAIAQCEVCPKLGPCELIGDILFCKSCYDKEMAALAANKLEAEQRVTDSKNATLAGQKLEPIDILSRAQRVDQSIEISQDIYNAHTVALTELIKAINDDATIENKPYARAKIAYDRIEQFQRAIFDMQQALVDARIGLRHSSEYLNQIINEVHESEREQFRVKDISYPAKPVKAPKVKSQAGAKVKFKAFKPDLVECAKFAKYLGVSQDAIHSLSAQHKIAAKGAARLLAGLMDLPWNDDWN